MIKQSFIDQIPNYSEFDLYKWADHIELACLLSNDGYMSDSDIEKKIKDVKDEYLYSDESKSEIDDKLEIFVKDCFKVLSNRNFSLNGFYPFDITDRNEIFIRNEESLNYDLYNILLVSSNLAMLEKKYEHNFTSSFEIISLFACKQLVSNNFEFFLFGSSNSESIAYNFKINSASAKLNDKLLKLAELTGEKIQAQSKEDNKTNVGDAGLDIFGLFKFKDRILSVPILFVQCACTDNWFEKQNSIKVDAWRNLISFHADPLYVVTIPISYRDASGYWQDDTKIYNSILIDRERIIELFDSQIDELKTLSSFGMIKKMFKKD